MYKLPLWIFVGTKHISPLKGILNFKVHDFSFPNLRPPNRQGMVAEDANVQTHILGPKDMQLDKTDCHFNYRYGLIIEPSEVNIKSTISKIRKPPPPQKKNWENCKCLAIPSCKLFKKPKAVSELSANFLPPISKGDSTYFLSPKIHRQQKSTENPPLKRFWFVCSSKALSDVSFNTGFLILEVFSGWRFEKRWSSSQKKVHSKHWNI